MCWGASTTLARVGIAEGLSSSDLTLLRFVTSGTILLPFLMTMRHEVTAKVGWYRAIILTVATGPAYSLLVAEGFQFAPLAHGAILFPVSTTLAAIAFGVCFLRETFGWRGCVGTAVLIGGLLLALHHDAGTPASSSAWIGDVMFIAAGALFGLYSFLLRKWRVGALAAASTVAVLSMLVCVVFALCAGARGLSQASSGELLIQIVGQGVAAGVIATIAFSKAVHLLGSAKAGLFAAMVPAMSLVIGIPLLHEIPTVAQSVGLILVTTGLAVTLIKRGTGTAAPTPTQEF